MALTYRPEIDGLRAIAVLPVILFHSGLEWFSGGYVGVDIFFVISGYLIGFILLQKKASGTLSILEFYENRARRILPALFFVVLACVPMAWLWADSSQFKELASSFSWVALFVSNHFFWMESGYFADSAELKPLLHTWSLAIEEQYYLVFPLLVLAFFRDSLKRFSILLVGLALVSFTYALWLWGRDPDGAFFFAPARVWELLAGALCAVILYSQTRENWVFPVLLSNVASLIGMGLIGYSIFAFDSTTPFPSAWTIFPVAGAALIVLGARPETLVAKVLSQKAFVGIGLISYSAYLWHQPLFAFARIRQTEEPAGSVMFGLAVLSLILAAFTWRFIEQPFRKQKPDHKIRGGRKILPEGKQVFSMALAGMIGMILLGQLQSRKIISPERFDRNAELIAQLEAIDKGRLEWIRMGTCDFFPTINWHGKWDCKAGEGADSKLQPVQIAIIGDSHANDKAMMLRQIGLSPTSFASSGCPITPNYVNEFWNLDADHENAGLLTKACFDLMEFGKAEIIANEDIKEIWLSNRFSEGALNPDVMKAALEYWSIPGKDLVFFSNIPEFPKLRRKLYRYSDDEPLPYYRPNLKGYNLSAKPRIRRLLKEFDVTFIDVKDLVCGIDQACDYKTSDGGLLYTDGAHMSPLGAKLAGERLLEIVGCNGASSVISEVNRDRGVCAKPQ